MTAEPIRTVPRHSRLDPESDPHLNEEWLVTNGLGGYASATIAGTLTRRYHGLLIAALPNPMGRMVMLNSLTERLRLSNRRVLYAGMRDLTEGSDEETLNVAEFRLEAGLPVWRYESDGLILEKRLLLPHGQNSVYITYKLIQAGGPVRLGLRPAVHFRRHDDPVNPDTTSLYRLSACEDQYELGAGPELPVLRLKLYGNHPAFTFDRRWTRGIIYTLEKNRGYEAEGALWSPGYFRVDLDPGAQLTLVGSTENWETICALKPQDALSAEVERRRLLLSAANGVQTLKAPAAELVLAADQFLIEPVGRTEDAARARAAGDQVRTVIAGYHWFTDWGRDTMISLEGLTLTTGRETEAGWILRAFGQYIRDGLIPNLFPEGEKQGLYHTADATLWFFHAIHRYIERTGDRTTLALLLPKLIDIINRHLEGTRFGIRVDPSDGLLTQGQEGYQLTWMDAKVGDWVVTPRRGKAVEINALWYNALRLTEGWAKDLGVGSPAELSRHAAQARESFNKRFWNSEHGYLFDVVDGEKGGNDPACRPNQLLAISLDYPVLAEEYWQPVLSVVTERLLTPFGLRSLAPGDPDYKPKYYGDLRARDAAYHQGTVWAWLIGPYIDAWLKVNPGDPRRARPFLQAFLQHLDQACIGTISEIFDAEPPFTARGCIAQAWSVAEVLRCWAKTA